MDIIGRNKVFITKSYKHSFKRSLAATFVILFQNVLIQMGLHVISLDGMLIREARSYVLKCYACFR